MTSFMNSSYDLQISEIPFTQKKWVPNEKNGDYD